MRFSFGADAPAPVVPAAVQQHPRYAAALRHLGADATCVAAWNGDSLLATACIVRRRLGPFHVTWVPRGPVWPLTTDEESRHHVLRNLPLRGLRIAQPETPEESVTFSVSGYRSVLGPPCVAELNLSRPSHERLASCHVKWRNRLRHAQSGTLSTENRPFDPVRDRPLLELEARQRRERRYAAMPPAFTLAWAAPGPGTTRLFLARDSDRLAAFILVLLHRPTATYHVGWTGPAGRRLSAHNLLIWQASEWLAARGFARFDLGQVDTRTAPGLARFKTGTGATIRALGPTMMRLPGLARPMRAA